jgi:hypothetical protein
MVHGISSTWGSAHDAELEALKAARIPWPQRLAVPVLREVAAQYDQLSRAAGRPSALSLVVRLGAARHLATGHHIIGGGRGCHANS